MSWLIWLDFGMFTVLLGLFVYMFSASSVTVLHRIYFLLHLIFMLWPLFQFASRTAGSLSHQLLFLSASHAGLSMLGFGWLIFILFLTGHSQAVGTRRLLLLSIPALLSFIAICWNPQGLFLSIRPEVSLFHRAQQGPLFWLMIGQLLLYMMISLIILLRRSGKLDYSARQRKMVRTSLNGLFLLTSFSLADLIVNVFFADQMPIRIPLVSIGMTATAIYIVHAINHNKVFDIIQIAQRDVMNTMSMGVIVLDDNNVIVEVNKIIKPIIRLRIGDFFEPASLMGQFDDRMSRKLTAFFQQQQSNPLERLEIELTIELGHLRHVIMQSAPILNQKKRIIGRVLSFQDVTELRMLVEATNSQNELLHVRNKELLIVQDELYQANKKLEQMAITDGLTGCFNRRYLLQQMEGEVYANIRYGVPFSIFIFDLDFFKTINDRYGHLVGDKVLCKTVDAVREVLRPTDVLARFGGEEFTVYLPHTNREQADMMAELVKSTVENNQIATEFGLVSVTISMGVVSVDQFEFVDPEKPKAYLRELMARADAALYEAKHSGRNRIVKSKPA